MRTLLLANNRTGLDAVPMVRDAGLEIAGVVVHPPQRARFRDEIIDATALPEESVFAGDMLQDPQTLSRIAALECACALSINFGYILRHEFLQMFPRGVYNLHPSLLPHGRGACPNVWAIVDRHPAGVTLHAIDDGVDTGDIIAQQEVPVADWDTGCTLYEKLHIAALELLRIALPELKADRLIRQPQPAAATTYRVQDLQRIDEIDPDRTYTARELIDILRARTFPPYEGAYFRDAAGRKVHLRLELTPEPMTDGSHTQ